MERFLMSDLPEWEWTPERYREIMDKVNSLKEAVLASPELLQRYNDIVITGYREIHTWMEQAIEYFLYSQGEVYDYWIKVEGIRAEALDGYRINLPKLPSPHIFQHNQFQAEYYGYDDIMHKEGAERRIWIEVYEKLASLYDEAMSTQADTVAPEMARGNRQEDSGNDFNLTNIRTLLTDGFTDIELRQLCFDEPKFRPVYEQLSDEMGKDRIIHKLIEYAERHELIGTLLDFLKQRNPAKYEKHINSDI
jgi:hypothetical protein